MDILVKTVVRSSSSVLRESQTGLKAFFETSCASALKHTRVKARSIVQILFLISSFGL